MDIAPVGDPMTGVDHDIKLSGRYGIALELGTHVCGLVLLIE